MILFPQIDQINRLVTEIVDQMSREKDEIEALRSYLEGQQEENIRRGELLARERATLLSQVEPMRVEREALRIKAAEVDKIQQVVKAEIQKYHNLTTLAESQKTKLDQDAAKYKLLEKKEADFNREVEDFTATKAVVLKQKEVLDERQKILDIREGELAIKEQRLERLYSST